MTYKPNATILLGLDGATFAVLDAMIAEGRMPFLAEFMASGARAELASTIPPTTPPAWTSMMTGRSPANHGIFDFFRPETPGSHSLRLVNSRHITCETIGSLLTRYDLKSINLNFPVMSPPIPISGYSISGFVPWKYLRRASHPPELMNELKTIPGFDLKEMGHDFSMEEKVVVGCSADEAEDWIRCHTAKDRQWHMVLQHLMKNDPCHLTAIVFDSPDRLQHAFYRLMDPACMEAPLSEEDRRIRGIICDHFSRLDRLMADIVAQAGPDADVFIASDHGFGSSYDCFFLNTWLAERGYLEWAESSAAENDGGADFSMDAIKNHGNLLDWDRTTAYVFTPSSNGIRIKMAEEGSGSGVRPEEYDNFVRKLGDELKEIKHPTKGIAIVEKLWTREEAFSGAELAPDLTLKLWDNGLVSTIKSDAIVKPRAKCGGVHYPNGVFIARGPRIREGVALEALSILDVAPALLYSLGLPIPDDYEGNVPEPAFRPEVLEADPVMRGEGTLSVDHSSEAEYEREKEEEEEIMKKLKELGYLE